MRLLSTLAGMPAAFRQRRAGARAALPVNLPAIFPAIFGTVLPAILPAVFGAIFGAGAALGQAQQGPATPAETSALASVSVEGVTLSGPLVTSGGRASLGNNSTVAAGEKSAELTLVRGGALRVCVGTSVHLSRDATPLAATAVGRATARAQADDTGLMVALDRGAFEAHYTTGKYSDVILTPDLRILVSGPGAADLKLRVNRQGDTCVDNHGANAPYVTVSSLMDGGVYRVQPGQRVLFEHGSLQEVVDREPEACGCPDPAPLAAGTFGTVGATGITAGGKQVGGPSSLPADTAFPTAVSEGLAPAPATPRAPVVPVGQAHAQVTATLSNDTPPSPPPAPPSPPGSPAASPAPTPIAAAPKTAPMQQRGLFGNIGHFFARVFRRG